MKSLLILSFALLSFFSSRSQKRIERVVDSVMMPSVWELQGYPRGYIFERSYTIIFVDEKNVLLDNLGTKHTFKIFLSNLSIDTARSKYYQDRRRSPSEDFLTQILFQRAGYHEATREEMEILTRNDRARRMPMGVPSFRPMPRIPNDPK